MKAILILSLLLSGSLSAQTVSLDNSFGTNGFTRVSNTFRIHKTLLTQDGKIVSIGYSQNPPTYIESAALTKHDLTGNLDLNFGINGVLQFQLNYSCQAFNGVLQEDGKIILIGTTYLNEEGYDMGDEHVFISRLKSNGELDSSFATNGSLISGNFDSFNTVFVNPDHSILISGNTYNAAMLYKLNEYGTPDNTFGTNGLIELIENGYNFNNSSAILLADGNILSVGSEGYTQISCQKLTLDGELITSFGQNGHLIYDINTGSPWESISQAIERADGKIALLGVSDDNFISLINPDGTIDSAFGTNGIVEFGYHFNHRCMLVQEDNKIIAGGSAVSGPNDLDIYFYRFTANGQLDPMFCSDGSCVLEITGYVDDMYSLEFLDPGHLLIAGTGWNTGYYVFLLASLDISQTLSAEELAAANFSIYPNPTENTLFIEGVSPQNVRILNSLGQLVAELPYDKESGVSLEKLSSGSYLVSFEDENGITGSEQFIKY